MPSVESIETLTPSEISRVLKLHPFTVTHLTRKGQLSVIKVGGVWRITKKLFERWIRDNVRYGKVRGGQRRQRISWSGGD